MKIQSSTRNIHKHRYDYCKAETGENQDSCFVQEQKRDRVKPVIHQHIMSVKRHTWCP